MKICKNCLNHRFDFFKNASEERFSVDCKHCLNPATSLYEVNEQNFEELYKWINSISKCYIQSSEGKIFSQLLQEDWKVFGDKFTQKTIDKILRKILNDNNEFDLSEKYSVQPDLLKNSWSNFVETINSKNRYFFQKPDVIEIELIKKYLESIVFKISPGVNYYRARRNAGTGMYNAAEMGAPPANKCFPGGRVNPPGISNLYLSESPEGAIEEIRPGIKDNINIATFTLKEEVEIVNLAVDLYPVPNPSFDPEDGIADISKTRFLLGYRDYMMTTVNVDNQQNWYIPTQIMGELAKTIKGVSGIIYPSAMGGVAKNLVFFDSDLLEIHDPVERYEVISLDFTSRKIS